MLILQFKNQAQLLASRLVPVSRCCFYEIGADLEPTGHVVLGEDDRWVYAYQPYRADHPFAIEAIARMYGVK